MKFEITRVSNKRDKPCEGAYLEKEIETPFGIVRVWCIDIESLEELFDLYQKVDEEEQGLILGKSTWLKPLYQITIHDDYIY